MLIDKASNKVAIKRYYVEVILNKVGIIEHGNNIIGSKIRQDKFENLFPTLLYSYFPKLTILTKTLNFHQIITSFCSYKILTQSFNH